MANGGTLIRRTICVCVSGCLSVVHLCFIYKTFLNAIGWLPPNSNGIYSRNGITAG